MQLSQTSDPFPGSYLVFGGTSSAASWIEQTVSIEAYAFEGSSFTLLAYMGNLVSGDKIIATVTIQDSDISTEYSTQVTERNLTESTKMILITITGEITKRSINAIIRFDFSSSTDFNTNFVDSVQFCTPFLLFSPFNLIPYEFCEFCEKCDRLFSEL